VTELDPDMAGRYRDAVKYSYNLMPSMTHRHSELKA
jgi:hypothetical protein